MTDTDDLTLPPAQDHEPGWAADLRSKFDKRTEEWRGSRNELAELKRENALLKAGFGDLDADKRKALLATVDGDVTEQALKDKAAAFGWWTPPPDPQAEAQQQADQAAATQERVADATAGGQSGTSGVIKPGDVAKWSADRWAQFKRQHPDAAEALKRGQEVTGLSL